MKLRSILWGGLAAGGLVLVGTMALAQTAAVTKKGTSANVTRGMAVDHAGGNGVRRADHPPAGKGSQVVQKPKSPKARRTRPGNMKQTN